MAGKIFGFVNADPRREALFSLPAGSYGVVVDQDRASPEAFRHRIGGEVAIPPQGTLILIKKETTPNEE